MNADSETNHGTARGRYRRLVDRARRHYRTAGETFACRGKELKLTWPDFIPSGEINLWTYWQGQLAFDEDGSSRVKIMLVGKDFGAVEKDSNVVVDACRKANGERLPWNLVETKGVSATDERLCQLFRQIDDRYDLVDEQYPELFFTNFIPAYREEGLSGGDFTKCFAGARDFFSDLVEILEPCAILCLGRDVYENAMLSLGGKPRIGSYNSVIEGGYDAVRLADGSQVAIFPLAHCGVMGTNNRNRSSAGKPSDLLALQRQDWEKVGRYLEVQGL